MSNEKRITEEEAMKELANFANLCYEKGVKDCLIGVGIGAGLAVLGMLGYEVISLWKEKKKSKNIELFNDETKQIIKEFIETES